MFDKYERYKIDNHKAMIKLQSHTVPWHARFLIFKSSWTNELRAYT